MRVRITKMPLEKAAYGKQVDGSLSLKPGAFGGGDYRSSDKTFYKGVKDTISAVPRDEANLEAEGGETAFGPISGQSIPDHVKINGKRHHEGGVPLNLPDDTFIFSDTASLKINDPAVLAMFNKTPKKGGYTPAEIAKPYNINKYKAILLDPDTGKLERNTATIMIKNYIMKLGALALVQESMKGFPQGIPTMAKPYMEANGITEEDLMPELKAQAEALAQSGNPGTAPQMPQEQNPMAAQEMQQMAPEQTMQDQQMMMNEGQGQPAYPQQMPSGAPVAMPQQDMGQPSPEGMMAYGGVPYAAYGMEMGGYDFPYYPEQMAYGGVPKFQGPENSQVGGGPGVTVNKIPASRVNTAPDATWKSGTVSGAGPNAQGWYQQGQARKSANKAVTGSGSGSFNRSGWEDAICNMVKNGATYEELTDPEVAFQKTGSRKTHMAPGAKSKAIFDRCNTKEVQEKFTEKAVYLENETPPKTCPCLDENGKEIPGKFAQQDENGNCLPETCKEEETLLCRCTDPVTGEVKEFPIEKEEECICQDGSRGQTSQGMAMGQRPHWSVPAQTNVLRNALMQVEPASSNVVLPGRAQIQGAYEEYQTKVDQGLAANQALQNAIMTGMAGSTGAKQAQMKDLLGKSLRASMDAVAGVQSRNVDRQRETNTQSATIDNANMMARTQALQQGLEAQRMRQDTRTSNVNKRLFNTMGAVMDADIEMGKRQNMNVTTPQYASEYDYGFITPTGVEKPLTGATGATLEDRIQYYLAKTGDYQKAFDMAYKEARLKSRYGGQTMADGGYVMASNVFPFIL